MTGVAKQNNKKREDTVQCIPGWKTVSYAIKIKKNNVQTVYEGRGEEGYDE